VASIEDKIVYIENRDGNANVKFEQAGTLSRAYVAKSAIKKTPATTEPTSVNEIPAIVVYKTSDAFNSPLSI